MAPPAKKKVGAKPKLHELAVEVAMGTLISDHRKRQFSLGKQFATGGFGRIYTCKETGTSKDLVVKIEPSGNGPLFTEIHVFQRILKAEQIEAFKKEKKLKFLGLPHLISAGVFDYKTEKLRYLIIPKYETSLEAVREKVGVFEPHQVWSVSRAILDSLQYMHSKDYTHADVKAANILLEKSTDLCSAVLVDFGLARLSSNNEDKPDKKRAHNGTAIFTSRDAHRGCHPSYRGDVEILAYNILYWLTGTLPWLSMESKPEQVFEAKKSFYNTLSASVTSHLKDHKESAGPLIEMMKVTEKMDYGQSVKYEALQKIVTTALAACKSSTRGSKRKSAEMQKETPIASKKKETQRKAPVAVSARKRLPIVEMEEEKKYDSDSSVEVVPTPSTSRARRAQRNTVIESDEEEEEIMTSSRKRVTSSVRKVTAPRSKVTGSNVTARRHAPIVAKAKRVSSDLGIVPGLATRQKPSGSAHMVTSSDEGEVEKENKRVEEREKKETNERQKAGPTAKVSTDTKKSPNQLRQMVPGMRNFPRGRRSEVITQISQKYKKMAAKKTAKK